ncbi:MAG: hypothetical protein IIC84_03735 [Chloroflexi bacterium]|nr:hypothetical protein [Chloroflexota bacterium]
MPKKGHRTASRQAQLSQKKRRGKGASQVFDAGPSESSVATAVEEPAVDATAEGELSQPTQTAVATARPSSAPARQPARRSRQRTSVESTPAVYRYLGAELKQIGMITMLIVAILIALTFVLGG